MQCNDLDIIKIFSTQKLISKHNVFEVKLVFASGYDHAHMHVLTHMPKGINT
jgi:hypothetical protein